MRGRLKLSRGFFMEKGLYKLGVRTLDTKEGNLGTNDLGPGLPGLSGF
jgi:hypothetical protein